LLALNLQPIGKQGMSDQVASVIHIHEDDWGMRNLYPIAARTEVANDLDAAREAGERNRDPSGIGWTAVYMTRPPSTDYREAGLMLAAAAAALEPIMPRVKRFYATASGAFGRATRDPFGSYEEEAWCFGRGAYCYMKLEVQGGLVERIWFDLSSSDPADAAALRLSIEAIDRLAPSLVADYSLDAEGLVADPDFLNDYFQHLAATAA
jgi:hypothetical protein